MQVRRMHCCPRVTAWTKGWPSDRHSAGTTSAFSGAAKAPGLIGEFDWPCEHAWQTNFSGTVTPIRAGTGRAGKPIRVGGLPVAIAVTPDGRKAYVVDSVTRGTVIPIRTVTNTVGTPIRVGNSP